MAHVPNPFKLVDDCLLDYVFNPFVWWADDRFNKDSVSIGTFCVVVGSVFVVMSLVLLNQIFLGPLGGFLCGVSIRRRAYSRRLWVRNNITGKNRLREFKWVSRSINLFTSLTITILLLLLLKGNFESEALINISSDYLWLVFILGMWFVVVIPAYLDATDATPPRYREFKTVPQT